MKLTGRRQNYIWNIKKWNTIDSMLKELLTFQLSLSLYYMWMKQKMSRRKIETPKTCIPKNLPIHCCPLHHRVCWIMIRRRIQGRLSDPEYSANRLTGPFRSHNSYRPFLLFVLGNIKIKKERTILTRVTFCYLIFFMFM